MTVAVRVIPCLDVDAGRVVKGVNFRDLRAIAGLVPAGVEGAIVGKALYAGAFTLEEALKAVSA